MFYVCKGKGRDKLNEKEEKQEEITYMHASSAYGQLSGIQVLCLFRIYFTSSYLLNVLYLQREWSRQVERKSL